MAAVLAWRPRGGLSHRSAAALWGLRPSNRERIEVTTPRAGGQLKTGHPDVHRSATLTPAHTTSHAGIPTTTVARTLLDLADVVRNAAARTRPRTGRDPQPPRCRQASASVLTRGPGRHGAATLHDLLADHHPGDTITRSELEERFLALCAAAGLPRPRVNAWIALPRRRRPGRLPLDRRSAWWSRPTATPPTAPARAFERDRRRDQRLMAAGYRVDALHLAPGRRAARASCATRSPRCCLRKRLSAQQPLASRMPCRSRFSASTTTSRWRCSSPAACPTR